MIKAIWEIQRDNPPPPPAPPPPPPSSRLGALEVIIVTAVVLLVIVSEYTLAHAGNSRLLLKNRLEFLRWQVEVYKEQHQGLPPGYTAGDQNSLPDGRTFIQQMTLSTDASGNTSALSDDAHPFGPYLGQIPVDPLNGLDTVEAVPNDQPVPKPDGSTGWIFQAQTGALIPNVPGSDSVGVAYANY